MRLKTIPVLCALMAIVAPAQFAMAQDAAETAVILSGTAQGQGAAGRRLGGAISGAMGSASDTIAATAPGRPSGARQAQVQVMRGPSIPTDNDPLEGTDAASYRLSSGATIRVSGHMTPSATTRCVENCEQEPATEEPAPE